MSDVNVSSDGAAVPAWRERKNLLLGGAVGGAVLLLAAYFLVFSGGGESEELGLVPSAANRAGAAGASSASATPTAASTLPAVFEEDIYGDPFEALYPAKPTPKPSTPAAAPVVAPAAPVAAATTPGTVASTPTSTAPQTNATSLRLVRVVDQDTVVVLVDGSKDESVFNIGTSFGGFYVLVSTRPDEDEATFNFGDGAPFTMVEGQTKKFST